MKKYMLIFLITSLFPILHSFADPVTQEDASKIAISWYARVARASVTDHSISNAFTLTKDGMVTLYVFNFTSGGFVIVAADDACIPILGYSEKNPFPGEIVCPAVKQWMEDYSKQIDQIVKTGISNRETITQWEAIRQGNFPPITRNVNPLLTTTWDQGCFYNALCPADPGGPCGHAVTGCVATAMAQIMKYHNFPPRGVGSYTYTHPLYGELSADFGNTIYEWNYMYDNITSANLAVATIMYHAGVAVKMDYGVANGSGAIPVFAKEALVNYFNYQPDIEIHYLEDYPDPEDWKTILRADLDNQLPVFYHGFPPSGMGHAFVCDGYILIPELNIDKFHFNWGWSGDYDGWYVIGALNPVNGDLNFNFNNMILTGIRPYHPGLITRITLPMDNSLFSTGTSVEIEAATVHGNAEHMKITIDGVAVATGASNILSFIWNMKDEDIGSHEVRSWSFFGNDSVYYPMNINVTDDWIKQASGFQTRLCVHYISAVDSNVVWAIARDGSDNPTWPCQAYTRTVDGGNTWVAGNISNYKNLTLSMIQGLSAQKAYAALYRTSGNGPQGIYVTSNGGSTWEHQATASFSNESSWIVSVHFFNENDGWCMGDPISEGSGFEMYITSNGGANWIPVPETNMPMSIPLETNLFDCFSAINDTIWFGTSCGRVFKSIDKGYTWAVTQVYEAIEEYLIPVFQNSSHGLAFNKLGKPRLFETFDGGTTWESVNYTGVLYQTALAFVPGTSNTWVSTGGEGWLREKEGVSYSEDGGHTWTVFPGTEGVSFRNMAWINPRCGWAGGFNSSATEGGIFKFTGNLGTPYAIDDPDVSINAVSYYPNPFTNSTTIEFELSRTADVEITIFNLLGKQVEAMSPKYYPQGKYKFTWNACLLPDGIYFIRMKTGNAAGVGKVVKMR